MPGTKHRTKRRNKRKPPYRAITGTSRAQKDSVSTVNLGTTPLISTTTPAATVSLQMSTSIPQTTPTATQKKLSKSPHASHLLDQSIETEFDNFEVAQALGKPYQHHKPPIPEAIVQLLKPIYARLGSRELLEKCLCGYTQNANESLHSTVWKFCPKELYLGISNVEIGCALAVCNFNDGASSLVSVTESLNLKSTSLCTHFLNSKDVKRIQKSKYKNTERAKYLRRAARRKRKGFDDKHQQKEGVICAFGDNTPGPSKHTKK